MESRAACQGQGVNKVAFTAPPPPTGKLSLALISGHIGPIKKAWDAEVAINGVFL